MDKYPEIKFMASATKDAQLGVNFLKYTRGKNAKKFLRNFFPDEIYNAIDKTKSTQVRNKLIRAYALKSHRKSKKEIERGLRRVKKEWASVEKKYFRLVDWIFKNHPWPKGKYRGFVTVFYMYPRDITHKTFYFPYKHRLPGYANKTIAHEMLHFMFFDYVHERYGLGEHARISGRPGNYLWQVSEAFNNAIEDWEPYRKIFKYKSSRPHPGTEELTEKMIREWARKPNVDILLDCYTSPIRRK